MRLNFWLCLLPRAEFSGRKEVSQNSWFSSLFCRHPTVGVVFSCVQSCPALGRALAQHQCPFLLWVFSLLVPSLCCSLAVWPWASVSSSVRWKSSVRPSLRPSPALRCSISKTHREPCNEQNGSVWCNKKLQNSLWSVFLLLFCFSINYLTSVSCIFSVTQTLYYFFSHSSKGTLSNCMMCQLRGHPGRSCILSGSTQFLDSLESPLCLLQPYLSVPLIKSEWCTDPLAFRMTVSPLQC